MRNYTRFIPGEEIDAVAQWRFGAMDPAALLLEEQARVREQEEREAAEVQHEALRQAAYADGFAQGRAHAMLEAQRQVNEFLSNQGQETAKQLAGLLESAHSQLDAAERVAAQGVLDLACELARQMLRHEIATNPNALLPVVREALTALFADSKNVQLKLNPLDLDMLQEALQAEFPGLAMTLLGDASIARGGCLVESAGTVVDGSLEKRWSRAIGRLGLKLPWEDEADEQ